MVSVDRLLISLSVRGLAGELGQVGFFGDGRRLGGL